jgi:hypothetical protein
LRTCWNVTTVGFKCHTWAAFPHLRPCLCMSMHCCSSTPPSLYISLCCDGYDGRKLHGARSLSHTCTCTCTCTHIHSFIHTRTFHHIPLHPHAQTPTTRTLTPNYTAAPDFNRHHVPPRTDDRSTCGSRSHARSVHHTHRSRPGCGCQGIRVGGGGRGCGRCRPRWSRGALRHSQEH